MSGVVGCLSTPLCRTCRQRPPGVRGMRFGHLHVPIWWLSREGSYPSACCRTAWGHRELGGRAQGVYSPHVRLPTSGRQAFPLEKQGCVGAICCPHSQACPLASSRDISFPMRLSPAPTYLLPFLDFIVHGAVSSLRLLPSWPPLLPCLPPTSPLFFFLPSRKLHQPRSSCPSHLIVVVVVCVWCVVCRG